MPNPSSFRQFSNLRAFLLSHEKGCKRDIKDNIRPALKDINPHKKCHICDRMFSFKKSVDRHIEAVQGGKKPFKCKICDQCFPQSNGLSSHVKRVHEGKRPFPCLKCNATISKKGGLTRHYKLVHADLKPYPCTLCPKRFKLNQTLKAHLSVHEEKKFECNISMQIKVFIG